VSYYIIVNLLYCGQVKSLERQLEDYIVSYYIIVNLLYCGQVKSLERQLEDYIVSYYIIVNLLYCGQVKSLERQLEAKASNADVQAALQRKANTLKPYFTT